MKRADDLGERTASITAALSKRFRRVQVTRHFSGMRHAGRTGLRISRFDTLNYLPARGNAQTKFIMTSATEPSAGLLNGEFFRASLWSSLAPAPSSSAYSTSPARRNVLALQLYSVKS